MSTGFLASGVKFLHPAEGKRHDLDLPWTSASLAPGGDSATAHGAGGDALSRWLPGTGSRRAVSGCGHRGGTLACLTEDKQVRVAQRCVRCGAVRQQQTIVETLEGKA